MKKILVGVDLSPAAEVAVAHAVAIARRTDAEVILALVTFVPEPPVAYERSMWPTYETYAELARRSLADEHAQLTALTQRFAGQGARVSQLIVDGRADDALPDLAAQVGADLLVVATHGRTGLTRVAMGSVAERAVRHAPCSVLVTRGAAPDGGYHQVVVGTDFEAPARAALALGARVAADGATLGLVSCWRLAPIMPVGEVGEPFAGATLHEEVAQDLRVRGAAALAEISRPGLTTRFDIVEQAPTWGVIDHATAIGADLIVVGSHGRRGLRRWLLGSVAETTVRHAPCSVLVARTAA